MQKLCLPYKLRSYECDENCAMRIVTLMNIFQNLADINATELGVGFEFCMQKQMAWVGLNYHIKIERFPHLHEELKLLTWPSDKNNRIATRDFMVLDASDMPIIKASSQWLLVDMLRKRPISLTEHLPDLVSLNERALNTTFEKIEDLTSVDFSKTFDVRYDDLDLNHHVNNSIYPLWAIEAVEPEFRRGHVPSEIAIAFKKEATYPEKIKVLTEKPDDVSVHLIKSDSEEKELARVKICWKKL